MVAYKNILVLMAFVYAAGFIVGSIGSHYLSMANDGLSQNTTGIYRQATSGQAVYGNQTVAVSAGSADTSAWMIFGPLAEPIRLACTMNGLDNILAMWLGNKALLTLVIGAFSSAVILGISVEVVQFLRGVAS